MAFTMHSHSGQFCSHAVDQLEDIIKHAISIGFKTMGLTEHMPRYEEQDLYPEERRQLKNDAEEYMQGMLTRHEAYLVEARRLQQLYAAQIHLVIGFEAEFIRPSFGVRVEALFEDPRIDYFVGSVHHVHSIPIDYDRETYAIAVASAGGSEERLYGDYYDLQLQMLTALQPRVVGHFDLVRLMSADPARETSRCWPPVWAKIRRNLAYAKEIGAWLECNSAALRKGLDEPYPSREIAQEWIRLGGRFTMSDDSHGIDHVATNYDRALTYLEGLGVEQLWTLRRQDHETAGDETRALLDDVGVPISEFRRHLSLSSAPSC